MRNFLLLVGTFTVVYLATPWVSYTVLGATVPGYSAGAGLLSIWLVYAVLRRRFGDRLPHV